MSRIFIDAYETARSPPRGPVVASGYIDQPLKRRYLEIYRHVAINKIGLQHIVMIIENHESKRILFRAVI